MSDDAINRAARVINEADWRADNVYRRGALSHETARALADAGLLATEERDRQVAADAWAKGYGAGYADRVAERPFDRGDNPHEAGEDGE